METLVCLPVAKAGILIPGQIVMECQECGQAIWVSPSGQKMLEEKKMSLLCLPCAKKRITSASEITSPTLEQLKEVEEALGRKPSLLTPEAIWEQLKE